MRTKVPIPEAEQRGGPPSEPRKTFEEDLSETDPVPVQSSPSTASLASGTDSCSPASGNSTASTPSRPNRDSFIDSPNNDRKAVTITKPKAAPRISLPMRQRLQRALEKEKAHHEQARQKREQKRQNAYQLEAEKMNEVQQVEQELQAAQAQVAALHTRLAELRADSPHVRLHSPPVSHPALPLTTATPPPSHHPPPAQTRSGGNQPRHRHRPPPTPSSPPPCRPPPPKSPPPRPPDCPERHRSKISPASGPPGSQPEFPATGPGGRHRGGTSPISGGSAEDRSHHSGVALVRGSSDSSQQSEDSSVSGFSESQQDHRYPVPGSSQSQQSEHCPISDSSDSDSEDKTAAADRPEGAMERLRRIRAAQAREDRERLWEAQDKADQAEEEEECVTAKKAKEEEDGSKPCKQVVEQKLVRYDLPDGGWLEQYNRLEPSLRLSGAAFEEIWALKPRERGAVTISGEHVHLPRYQQNFGVMYSFAGMDQAGAPLPKVLRPFKEWVERRENHTYQQLLVNWYEGPDDYIGPHADNEPQLVPRATIYSFSFHTGPARSFCLHPKKRGPTQPGMNTMMMSSKEEDKESESIPRLTLSMRHNSLIVMGGTIQEKFLHSVPRLSQEERRLAEVRFGEIRRINITLRRFKTPITHRKYSDGGRQNGRAHSNRRDRPRQQRHGLSDERIGWV
eukprot:g66103.t1